MPARCVHADDRQCTDEFAGAVIGFPRLRDAPSPSRGKYQEVAKQELAMAPSNRAEIPAFEATSLATPAPEEDDAVLCVQESILALENQRFLALQLGEDDIANELQVHLDGLSRKAQQLRKMAEEVKLFFLSLHFSRSEAVKYSRGLSAGGFRDISSILERATADDYLEAGLLPDHARRLATAAMLMKSEQHARTRIAAQLRRTAPAKRAKVASPPPARPAWTAVPESSDARVSEFVWSLSGTGSLPSKDDVMGLLKSSKARGVPVRLITTTFNEARALLVAMVDTPLWSACSREEANGLVAQLVARSMQDRIGSAFGERSVRFSADQGEVFAHVGRGDPPLFGVREMAELEKTMSLCTPSHAELIGARAEISPRLTCEESRCAALSEVASSIKQKLVQCKVPCADTLDDLPVGHELVNSLAAARSTGSAIASTLMGWVRKDGSARSFVNGDPLTGLEHEFQIVDCLTKSERMLGAHQIAELVPSDYEEMNISLGHIGDSSNPILAASSTSALAMVVAAVLGVERVARRPIEVVEVRGCRGCAIQFGVEDRKEDEDDQGECVIS